MMKGMSEPIRSHLLSLEQMFCTEKGSGNITEGTWSYKKLIHFTDTPSVSQHLRTSYQFCLKQQKQIFFKVTCLPMDVPCHVHFFICFLNEHNEISKINFLTMFTKTTTFFTRSI